MSQFSISVVIHIKGSDSVNVIAESTYELCKYLNDVYTRVKKKFGDMDVTVRMKSSGKEESFTYELTETDKELNPYFRWDRMLKIIQKKLEHLT